jgi:hypothetical protein
VVYFDIIQGVKLRIIRLLLFEMVKLQNGDGKKIFSTL